MPQVLIPQDAFEQMIENGRKSNAGERIDPLPIVKLFMPGTGWTWLLTEIDPDNHDRAFGVACNGYDDPEYGWVSISELSAVRGRMGLAVERDEWFNPAGPLSEYAQREGGQFAM